MSERGRQRKDSQNIMLEMMRGGSKRGRRGIIQGGRKLKRWRDERDYSKSEMR